MILHTKQISAILGRKRGVRLIHEGGLYNINYGSKNEDNIVSLEPKGHQLCVKWYE